MDTAAWNAALPWLAVALVLLFAVALFPRLTHALLGLIRRTGIGLGILAAFAPLGQLTGAALGVNLFNALTLAFLGAPGFGLLLLTHWLLR